VTAAREEHPAKQSSRSRSTDDGMQIDKSDEQPAKALPSIHESFESDSNVTVEREEQATKEDGESRSTDDGMQIDDSDKQS
jgi:hypothetical protein